ncbi:MAG: CoA ester lyase [Desulfobacterales bacterium]|nr:CoA ester lyase [Desulfobacterales bacterium]
MKPARSILSVPGHQTKMHIKASQSEADAVMLDLEDSVPLDSKDDARKIIIDSLRSLNWSTKKRVVRINSVDTHLAYQDIIAIVQHAGHCIDGIVVPKVNNPGDIHFVSRLLDGVEQHFHLDHEIAIEASIETATGLNQVSEIAMASHRLSSLVFGVADYSASVGARLVSISGHGENEESIYPGHRWHFCLSKMVMAAKANGLTAVDAPYGYFQDVEGLNSQSKMAAALGCDAKWAIHPMQISVINAVFSPSKEDIDRAQQIMNAANQALHQKKGAISLDGRMIDGATVRLAEQTFVRATQFGLL